MQTCTIGAQLHLSFQLFRMTLHKNIITVKLYMILKYARFRAQYRQNNIEEQKLGWGTLEEKRQQIELTIYQKVKLNLYQMSLLTTYFETNTRQSPKKKTNTTYALVARYVDIYDNVPLFIELLMDPIKNSSWDASKKKEKKTCGCIFGRR